MVLTSVGYPRVPYLYKGFIDLGYANVRSHTHGMNQLEKFFLFALSELQTTVYSLPLPFTNCLTWHFSFLCDSHFSGLTRQGGQSVFHGLGWGRGTLVSKFCGGSWSPVFQRGSCSPNFVSQTDWEGGKFAPTVSLHCFFLLLGGRRTLSVSTLLLVWFCR